MKKLTPLAVARIAFPAWKGRRVTVSTSDATPIGGTSWSEGSRSQFVAVRLETGEVCELPESTKTPRSMGGTEPDTKIRIPAGYAMVQHSIFCGADAGCVVTFGALPALGSSTPSELLSGSK